MNIHTTINISANDRKVIAKTSAMLEIKKSALISSLAQYAGRKIRACPDMGSSIRYQEKRPKDEWRRLHLSFRGDEYEYCIDLRKVFKLSVSCFIAHAIKHYLDDLIKLIIKGTDNYRYRNYAMMSFNIENVMCRVYYWGIPRVLLAPSHDRIE